MARKYRGTAGGEQRSQFFKQTDFGRAAGGEERTSKEPRHADLDGQADRVDGRSDVARHVESKDHEQEPGSSARPDGRSNQSSHTVRSLSLLPDLKRAGRALEGGTHDLDQHGREEQSEVDVEEDGPRLCLGREIGRVVAAERCPRRDEPDAGRSETEHPAGRVGETERDFSLGDHGERGPGNRGDRDEEDDRDGQHREREVVHGLETQERGLRITRARLRQYEPGRSRVFKTHQQTDEGNQDDSQTPADCALARETESLTSQDSVERGESDGSAGVADGGTEDRPVSER